MPQPQLERILYVEDDSDIREVAVMALEALGGFQVKACASGEEAVQQAHDFAPQLIILDVMMPGMDGPATMLALRRIASLLRVPVIFMTAKVQPAEVLELQALGAAGVVSKPFDPMTLPDQLQAIWKNVPAPA